MLRIMVISREDHEEPSGEYESDWNSLAFKQRKSFPHCTTPFCKEKNIAHTHSTERCYTLHPPKGKGGSGKGGTSLYSIKAKGAQAKEKGKPKAKAREILERTSVIAKARAPRERTLEV
jgi:hypothetical protein